MILKLFIFLLTAFVSGADPTLDKFMGGGNMMRTPYESYGGYVEEFMSMQCYMKEGRIYVDTDSVMRYPENESVRHAGIGYMTSGIAKNQRGKGEPRRRRVYQLFVCARHRSYRQEGG